MQASGYSLHIFLIIYYFSILFTFSDSSWQSIHDVSVYVQFLSLIFGDFFFNEVVVDTVKIKNRRKEKMQWQWRVRGSLIHDELDC